MLFLIEHESELLRSEARQLGVLVERLQRRHFDVEQRDATDEERAWRSSADRSTAPPTVGSATRVVWVRLARPRLARDGRTVGRGLAEVLLLRAPSWSTEFSMSFDPDGSWLGSDDWWTRFFSGLLRPSEAP
jgi:hypothetical protein